MSVRHVRLPLAIAAAISVSLFLPLTVCSAQARRPSGTRRSTSPAARQSCAVASTAEGWVLTSPSMRIAVSKTTGQITSLVAGKEMLTAPAGIVLADKVAGKTFAAADGRTTASGARASANEASVTFTREYGTDYVAAVKLTLTRDALRWDVEVTTNLAPDREANIDYVLPVMAAAGEAFWAAPGAPASAARMGGQEIIYRTNTFLPWFALYDKAKDCGLSLIEPPDVPKPGLTVHIDGPNPPKSVTMSNHHLRLGKSRSARTTLCIVPHAGDWRPGLGWLVAKYPAYFRPVSKHVTDGEGWYTEAWPGSEEPAMVDTASRGVTWQELHGHFPFYGVYLPDTPTWPVVMDQDAVTLDRWEKRDAPGMYVNSFDNMRNKMALWRKHGIQVYIYYQTFEAWHQYAEKYFPADIARDAEGKPCIAWQFCNLMNPDPSTKWGEHILRQLDQIIATYPDLDGVFLDRDDYRDYDFSHDDGLSMQDSRPCYMLAFAQEKALRQIGSKLNAHDQGIWTNGPTSLEVCKGVDGLMSEAVGPLANQIQLLGVERPMICLPYDMDPRATEVKLKTCLMGGYFPAATDLGPGTPSRALEAKYAPLLGLMKGRRWVLTAHAITVPAGLEGNLFRAASGDYLAAVSGERATQVVPAGAAPTVTRDVQVQARIPNAAAIRHCYLLSGDYAGASELPFTRSGDVLTARIPVHFAASLLVFSPAKRYDVTVQTEPIVIRGTANRIVLRGLDAGDRIQTPWGEVTPKPSGAAKAGVYETAIDIPADAAKGEARLAAVSGGTTTPFSVWVVDPVEAHPAERIYLREPDGEDMTVELSNFASAPRTVTLAGTFVDGAGAVTVAEPTFTIPAKARRAATVRVAMSSADGRLRLRGTSDGKTTTADVVVGAATRFSQDDLFHDDFSSGTMDKWTVQSGTWEVNGGAAKASGPMHLATTGDAAWRDYSFEASSQMNGSAGLAIGWLKSYVFFRVQGPASFYRFGFHGDSAVLELAKCVNGTWTNIAQTPALYAKGSWVTLRVVAKGSDIRCFADGKQVLQVKDDTFPAGGIGIGVLENDMLNTYRHVVVKRAE